jgi:hypothetical protein
MGGDRNMLGDTTLASSDEVAQFLQVIRFEADLQQMSQMPVTDDSNEAGGYARALQALRDVRHLLPCEGVAIVDAVLDLAS